MCNTSKGLTQTMALRGMIFTTTSSSWRMLGRVSHTLLVRWWPCLLVFFLLIICAMFIFNRFLLYLIMFYYFLSSFLIVFHFSSLLLFFGFLFPRSSGLWWPRQPVHWQYCVPRAQRWAKLRQHLAVLARPRRRVHRQQMHLAALNQHWQCRGWDCAWLRNVPGREERSAAVESNLHDGHVACLWRDWFLRQRILYLGPFCYLRQLRLRCWPYLSGQLRQEPAGVRNAVNRRAVHAAEYAAAGHLFCK